jgi:hypothetical protein
MKDQAELKSTQQSLPGRMLEILSGGGIRSTAELARRLEISEGIVTALAENLARHGYLAPVPTDCTTSCSGCWASASCGGTRSRAPMLALTPKGRHAAGKTG